MPPPAKRILRELKTQVRREERFETILETILNIPVEALPWDELEEIKAYGKKGSIITLEEAMHLAMVKEAVGGNTAAYKALLERAKGRIPTTQISVSTDYKTFLEKAKQIEEKEVFEIEGERNTKVEVKEIYEEEEEDEEDEDLSDL